MVDRGLLARRLEEAASALAEGDGQEGLVPAAVLVPILDGTGGPRILLTKRSRGLKDHAGQVSFPGGRMEPGDPDPAATALREAEEEVGLAPGRVALLGRLPCCRTGTGFLIHPVVGWIEGEPALRPDPVEVDEIFFVPLGDVLDPGRYRWERVEVREGARPFPVLPHPRHRIWGATARILLELALLSSGRE